ncbi:MULTISPECIES: TetR/AcrR family transcriptional regulator [Streptomyces]|uniref:TetR/AcrR family transcriptional regulator n=1 Tax=Streptomyces olivaceus TaxID=47716 RepID=A0ABS7VZV1_STROV|nr:MULTISPECIES: TetR/AcrR family transcriptional regulator [Streptomyces]AOW90737.1 TetR family transcriptional regulator [Streptomyces olivaceus]MBZ6084515.1 TetR/AcrR family transcriptional regulator [Streptomyces olivaceus]MBZ6088406.1 TetR/AcrR family transcriptional regulator [Streptomyces olivaceus]MBZ6094757.1 TetR/AcrR family transcriptional regulator [Streptomyces olivaceus]MBZ6113254.1 TetR/AcrR family transcriptional regulator [Streptomyces olivaceus]
MSPDQEPTPAAERPEQPGGAERPLRAHARRNRENLVAAARDAFAAADDTVPLEGIARRAGVGIGTLYRHFPTREALVEAVYAAELDAVTDSAAALVEELPPEQALRAWMERYAAFVATKRTMLNTLHSGWASGRLATPVTRERITAAIGAFLAAGARTGALRADVEAEDVTAMVLGVFLSTGADAGPGRLERRLGLVVDALRPREGS